MKLFAFLSSRKKEAKVSNHGQFEAGNVEQDALMDKPKQGKVVVKSSKENNPCENAAALIVTFGVPFLVMVIVLTAFYRWIPPPFTPNENPNRTVYLNKRDSGYGLSIDGWNELSEVTPGSAADFSGEIKMGEELLSINGVSIARLSLGNSTIQSLLNTRNDGVELIVAPVHMDPLWFSAAMATVVTLCCVLVMILDNRIRYAWNWWKRRGTVTRAVKLTRTEGSYGFMMSNGKIEEITPGGSADSQSNLTKGDVIEKVNGVDVEGLDDWRILQIFKTRTNTMHLVVRRKEGK